MKRGETHRIETKLGRDEREREERDDGTKVQRSGIRR